VIGMASKNFKYLNELIHSGLNPFKCFENASGHKLKCLQAPNQIEDVVVSMWISDEEISN
jgi:hypothetical protein